MQFPLWERTDEDFSFSMLVQSASLSIIIIGS
jgi:hypothetical protein